MKKIVSMMLLMVAVSMLAGVLEPFKQFTQADFTDAAKPGQPWASAQVFTLSVKANTSVWLSNYVRSFYEPIPDLHGNVYNMAPEKYGYIFKEDLPKLDLANGSYDSLIHWADGKTTTITYTASSNPNITNDAKGYLLDEFKKDAEIYLVMTTLPSDGGETVDTYQYVQDADHATTLQSRQHNTVDLAGNVRINFGIDSVGAREFVAVYAPSGQPLPGLLFAGMLSLGTVFAAAKLRKRS
jgi:hypothetical protein